MCYSLWYNAPTMLPAGGRQHRGCIIPQAVTHRHTAGLRPATSWVHYTTSCNTQSSAPEDGRNHRPKHAELIRIINKPLFLHLVSCLYYLYPE